MEDRAGGEGGPGDFTVGSSGCSSTVANDESDSGGGGECFSTSFRGQGDPGDKDCLCTTCGDGDSDNKKFRSTSDRLSTCIGV